MARRLFQYDPLISYRFIPCLKARVDHESGGYLFKTNTLGFRSKHEFNKCKEPNQKRVLIFGDSFTAGDGVSDGKRYSDILENMLPNTEIFNFGMPGTGTDQHYLIWKNFAMDIEHDLVIIGLQVHNINRIIARYRKYLNKEGNTILLAKPYFELDSYGRIQLRNVPVPPEKLSIESLNSDQLEYIERTGRMIWLRSLIKKFGPSAKDFAQRLVRFQPLEAYNTRLNPAWLLMEAILQKWVSEIEKPVIICPIPLYQYIEQISSPNHYQERFRSIERIPKIFIHDPLQDFLQFPYNIRREFRFKVDQHFTPSGHKVLAESLLKSIKPLLTNNSTNL